MYDQSSMQRQKQIQGYNMFLQALSKGIDLVNTNHTGFEICRDNVRALLHNHKPLEFPVEGARGTDIRTLTITMLQKALPQSNWIPRCSRCNKSEHATFKLDSLLYLHRNCLPSSLGRSRVTTTSTSMWIKYATQTNSDIACSTCGNLMTNIMKVDNNPLFLVLSWDNPGMRIKWEHCINFNGSKYRLCGIIYWEHYDFTCRIVQKDGSGFYHEMCF